MTVLHYHADNGRFADNKFRQAVNQVRGQTLSFCGVNAHFQNGVAERRIRELQDHARTMLIHSSKRWPTAINTHLWPYALRMANDIMNATPNLKTGGVPLNVFAGSGIASNPKHWYPIGCPVYVLDSDMQAGKKLSKWSDRARVGIYLGHSPQHARTVALVLSLTTGLVSPQFHVRMDPTFHTLRSIFGGSSPPSQWQNKCHFVPSEGLRAPTVGAVEKQASASEDQASGEATEPTSLSEHGPFQQRTDLAERHKPTTAEINPSEGASTTQVGEEHHRLQGSGESPRGDDQLQPQSGSNSQPQRSDSQPQQRSEESDQATSRRSTRQKKPRQRLIEAHEAELKHANKTYVAYEVLAEIDNGIDDANPLLAFAASADPDTMYFHEAMRQPVENNSLKPCPRKSSCKRRTEIGLFVRPVRSLPGPRFFRQFGR